MDFFLKLFLGNYIRFYGPVNGYAIECEMILDRIITPNIVPCAITIVDNYIQFYVAYAPCHRHRVTLHSFIRSALKASLIHDEASIDLK